MGCSFVCLSFTQDSRRSLWGKQGWPHPAGPGKREARPQGSCVRPGCHTDSSRPGVALGASPTQYSFQRWTCFFSPPKCCRLGTTPISYEFFTFKAMWARGPHINPISWWNLVLMALLLTYMFIPDIEKLLLFFLFFPIQSKASSHLPAQSLLLACNLHGSFLLKVRTYVEFHCPFLVSWGLCNPSFPWGSLLLTFL